MPHPPPACQLFSTSLRPYLLIGFDHSPVGLSLGVVVACSCGWDYPEFFKFSSHSPSDGEFQSQRNMDRWEESLQDLILRSGGTNLVVNVHLMKPMGNISVIIFSSLSALPCSQACFMVWVSAPSVMSVQRAVCHTHAWHLPVVAGTKQVQFFH